MNPHEEQQFQFWLQTAVERFAERLVQRYRGPDVALQQLRESGCTNEIAEFVEAVFHDFLMDNVEGACFVLRALSRRPVGNISLAPQQTVQSLLIQVAKDQFQQLLLNKTLESLEQQSSYQAVQIAEGS